MSNFSVTIVVPSIRYESVLKFLNLWEKEFRSHRVIIVEDNPKKTFLLPSWVEHYSWKDIDSELKEKSWIVPRRTDCIRSFGFYKAYQRKCDFVVTMDDDCYPEKSYSTPFLEQIYKNLNKRYFDDSWWNTLKGNVKPRGYPYQIRNKREETVIHHGLWSNIPDLDAVTQKEIPDFRTGSASSVDKVPKGKFFPMCGMNLAFKPNVIPALYFLLMGQDKNGNFWGYDRFGDIWAGIIIKKICDHLGYAISSGSPSVYHARASNVEVNLKKEKPGYKINEFFWQKISNISLKSDSFASCYKEISDKLGICGNYWDRLRDAMKIWVELF